jgi:hypothetical protein
MKLNRILIATLLCSAAICLSASAAEPSQPASNAAITIPKEATKNADGSFSFTDKQGKKWLYRTSEFGVSRVLDVQPSSGLPKGVPAGATANPDGTFAWTDKSGARWTYVMTPFGISRSPAVNTVAATQQAPGADIKVLDKGDIVRFERPGPSGSSVWEKKKTDLTSEERQLLDKQQAADAQKAQH